MSDLLSTIASVTGCRDRSLLAATVVWLLADALDARSVDLYQLVGQPARLRRLAAERRGAVAPGPDAEWLAEEMLPAVAQRPAWRTAIETGRPAREDEAGRARLVLPVTLGSERIALVDIETDAPLGVEAQRTAAGVLRLYRNQLELLDYGERDTLTGLFNRKTFDAQFSRCLLDDAADAALPPGQTERRRPAGRHWMAVIDIDHFKRVNDVHGHLIGDEVLLLVAGVLRASFRGGDRLYRFGGEEFVVLLRAPERAAALGAFERCRALMEAAQFPQVGQVTASLGCTELRANDAATAAFERADRAVYHAKQTGRNRVCCHEALVAEGVLAEAGRFGEIELF